MIAFNYGSRAEIARAARRLAERALEGTIKPADITPEALSAALDTQGVPDPDLLIRTSGELRLSNFLLWQSAYTEFVFLDAAGPTSAASCCSRRSTSSAGASRRFGGVVARVDRLTWPEQMRKRDERTRRCRAGTAAASAVATARLGGDFHLRLAAGLAMGAVALRCSPWPA